MPSISKQQQPSLDLSKRNDKRRALDWRPRTADEIVRKKNCKVISHHLRRIGKAAGRELTLDLNGVCYFSFKKFVICVEVPEDNSSICLFHSKVCHLDPLDNRPEVQKIVDLYNQRQATTLQELQDVSSSSESTCVGIDPLIVSPRVRLAIKDVDEVSLSLSFDIKGLRFQDTGDKLELFIKTAVAANRKLETAKVIPLPPLEAVKTIALPEEPPPSPSFRSRLRLWSLDSHSSTGNLSQCSLFSMFSSATSSSQH